MAREALFWAAALLCASRAGAQVRHAWSVAPSVRLGLAPPRARRSVGLEGGRARRRLDEAAGGGGRRAEARARSFGSALPLGNVSIGTAGAWETLPDGSRLWRLVLRCPGAQSVHVFCGRFRLLRGDRLYLHDGRSVGTRGAYSEANNAPHRTFASPPTPGDELHLELHEEGTSREGAGGRAARPGRAAAPEEGAPGGRLLEISLLVAGTTPLFGAAAWQRATGRPAAAASRAAAAGGGLGSGGGERDGGAGGGDGGGAPAAPASSAGAAGARAARRLAALPAGGEAEKGEAAGVRLSSWVDASGACMVNERCEVGRRWAAQGAAVAAIVEHRTASVCTGALVNSLGSGKPRQLLLTAYHCVRSRVEEAGFDAADNFLPWSFVFNWQAERCADGAPPAAGARAHAGGVDSVYGASVRAWGNDTDFALLELHETIPPEFGVFYAGWDASGSVPNMSLTIHHPASDLKKVSIDYDPPSSRPFGGDGYYQLIFGQRRVWAAPHWYVARYEVGSTEGGSSGAPLFDWSGRLVGVLHGGYADCASPSQDWYGKLALQWAEAPQWFQQGRRGSLQHWLDPETTGQLLNDGAWLRPHAHTPHALAAVELGATSLSFSAASGVERGGAHQPPVPSRSLSLSLLSPPSHPLALSAQLLGDAAQDEAANEAARRCFRAEPAQLSFEPAEWEAVQWLTVSALAHGGGAGGAGCADVSARLRFSLVSADEAYAPPPDVRLIGPAEPGAGGAEGGAAGGYDVPAPGFFLVGCYAALPAEHRRLLQSGAASGADACHRPCVAEGYDHFMLGSGACYCLGAAAVDREVPADDLPSRACHGPGVRTFSLYRSLSLGAVLGVPSLAQEARERAGPAAPRRAFAPLLVCALALAALLAARARRPAAGRRGADGVVAPAGELF